MKPFASLAFILFLISCKSNEIGNLQDVNPDAVYQEYSVDFTQGNNDVNCFAQFRFAGHNGTTLVLGDKSNISLDGKNIKVDSTTYRGAFYDANFAPSSAETQHSWIFQDMNGKKYTNHFSFQPIQLLNHFDFPINKGDLKLLFSGTKENDEIQIGITDTANNHLACDTIVAIKNNAILLPANFISRLSPGPISFNISHSKNIPLKAATKEGGSFNYRFNLKKINANLLNGKKE